MKNVNIKSIDFMSTKVPVGYDVIILNPPFSAKKEGKAGGGHGLWKKFLTHALKSATEKTLTICFVPRTTAHIGFEHEVLIDEVTFDNANTSARVIMIRGRGVKTKRERVTVNGFDVKVIETYDKVTDESVYGIHVPYNGTYKSDKDMKPTLFTRARGKSRTIVGSKAELARLSKFISENSTYEDWNEEFRRVRKMKNGMANFSSDLVAKFVNSLGK
jgi:hypothetical protein